MMSVPNALSCRFAILLLVTTFAPAVYARLLDALRLLTGQDRPHKTSVVALTDIYQAAVSISLAIDESKIPGDYAPFYRDVFKSPEFAASDSAFHAAVVDLWTRYLQVGKSVPYTSLLLLNQERMGYPDGQDNEYLRAEIAQDYSDLGDHLAAAKWYEKVSPVGLGPLKVADELFAAKQYRDADAKYRSVRSNLNAWAARQPALMKLPMSTPLQQADMNEIRKHVEMRIQEIRKLLSESTRTK